MTRGACLNQVTNNKTETPTKVHSDLTYLYLNVGITRDQTQRIFALKDNGASKSFISKKAFTKIPNHDLLHLIPVNSRITLASNGQETKCNYIAPLWVTFDTTQGISKPFKHHFLLVDNLQESIYLGNDFLTGPHKILETPTQLVLSNDKTIKRTITVTPATEAYTVPMFTQNIPIPSEIILQPNETIAIHIAQPHR